ncbi:regulatory solute carrier protein family 1 member 1 isoform X1 [Bufo bufo]|uniref:regulatory solute carrier protein family 1 member 1 isoform X1 n=1 Tax=Bufo bufo TaxID=8384 RepID=UPI001ABEB01B|nr:regulatory solute carrier protein family 1 member 1 isoform X1 [Bufo bufo]
MHVCVICRRRGRTADKESTSEAGPSLVPPMDGSTHPVHNSDNVPSAHQASTPLSASESRDVPREDVACTSGSHTGGSEQVGHTSNLLGSAVAVDQPGVESSSSLTSVVDGDSGLVLATAVKSAVTTITNAGSEVYKESGCEPHVDNAPPPSTLTPVEDGVQEMTQVLCAMTEDMMELGTEVIPDLDGCRPQINITVQDPECQHVFRNDPPTNPEESEDVDNATKHDCPKPPSTSVQDGDESCFSLATALKELHKLLIISGQGSAWARDDGALGAEADHVDDVQGSHRESCQNGDVDNDLHLETGMSGQVADEVPRSNEADSLQVTSRNDYSSDCMESSDVSAPDQPLPGTVRSQDADTGAMHNSGDREAEEEQVLELSRESEGAVCEWSSSMTPSDPTSHSAVERIVSAGFTMHDALVALERADGNVEMALLALLVKNIVVPT